MDEIELTGGNATASVVRVGSTVRKPFPGASVVAFANRIAAAGVDVPHFFGRDELGRQMIEYVPGELADTRALSTADLTRVGALIRSIHDAAEGAPLDGEWSALLPPPAPADLLCHNDLTPWNLVTGDRWVFIDWDGAGPSTRAWDLAYSVPAFAGLVADSDPLGGVERIRALLSGYRATRQLASEVIGLMPSRSQAMADMLAAAAKSGRQPWARLHAEGHGQFWADSAEFLRRHQSLWFTALPDPDAAGCDSPGAAV